MIGYIRKHLDIIPFAVRPAEGREYPVPTIDHVDLPPGSRRVVISDDERITVALPALSISGLGQARSFAQSH